MKLLVSGNKWAEFDTLALEASRAWDEWRAYNSAVNNRLGNTITTPGMITGNIWPNWSDEDRAENRRLLAIAYDAQDKAIKARPARVHKRTAINRLRSILEG